MNVDSKHKKKIAPFVLAAVVTPVVMLAAALLLRYFIPIIIPGLVFTEDADIIVALISGLISYAGTCFIGIVAMWQNNQLSDVNERLLTLEELKLMPAIKPSIIGIHNIEDGVELRFRLATMNNQMARDVCLSSIIIRQGEMRFEIGDIAKRNIYNGEPQNYSLLCRGLDSRLMDKIYMDFIVDYDDISYRHHSIPCQLFWLAGEWKLKVPPKYCNVQSSDNGCAYN